MKINREKVIENIKDEDVINSLIEHLAYSIADIDSYEELTDSEKKILPKEIFDKLV